MISTNSQEFNIVNITWTQYNDLCNSLVETILESGWRVDYVSGVPRGGLLLATIFSNKLGVPFVHYDSVVLAKDGYNILVLDDIVKSGKTINLLKKHYKNLNVLKNIKFASLFCLKDSGCFPDYCVENIDYDIDKSWIVLPFEHPDEFLVRVPEAKMSYDNLLYTIESSFVCPKCEDSKNQIKKGRTNSGSQRAYCKFCDYRYTPFKKGYTDAVRHSAVLAYISGYSSGKVSEMLGVDSDTVLSWVSTYAGKDKIRRTKF